MDITGTATVTGVGGGITANGGDLSYTGEFTAATIDTNADQMLTGLELSSNADVKETMDANGEIAGYRVRKKQRTLTIRFFPTAASGAATLANALKAMELPKIPSVVTITNCFVATTGTGVPRFNGDWIYKGGGSISTSDDVVGMTLPLVQELSASGSKTATQLTTLIS